MNLIQWLGKWEVRDGARRLMETGVTGILSKNWVSLTKPPVFVAACLATNRTNRPCELEDRKWALWALGVPTNMKWRCSTLPHLWWLILSAKANLLFQCHVCSFTLSSWQGRALASIQAEWKGFYNYRPSLGICTPLFHLTQICLVLENESPNKKATVLDDISLPSDTPAISKVLIGLQSDAG